MNSVISVHFRMILLKISVIFIHFQEISVISVNFKVISRIIKWSGILANFAYSWLAETLFTRPYLRVSTPQMLNDGLFGASVMSQRKRRFSRQIFAQTDEFDVHFHMTSQYTHLRRRSTNTWRGLHGTE